MCFDCCFHGNIFQSSYGVLRTPFLISMATLPDTQQHYDCCPATTSTNLPRLIVTMPSC